MITPPLYEIILVALALGFDAFSVALASGAHGFLPRRVFRLSWHFGLFQFVMPIIGWVVGEAIAGWLGHYGGWVVFALLAVIGGKMLWEGLKNSPEDIPDLSRGWNLITMAVGTSIDALGVGFGFGIMHYEILKPAAAIGIICVLMTAIGLFLGVKLYSLLKHRAIILGGLILIAIGIKSIF